MMNWKGFGRKWSQPDFEILPQDSSGGAEENHENLSQDNWSEGQDLNLGLPEYKARVLTN
jgi:hypothetical protein